MRQDWHGTSNYTYISLWKMVWQGGVVCIVIRLQAGWQISFISSRGKNFFLLWSFQTGSGAHPASSLYHNYVARVGGGLSLGGEGQVAGAWSWQLTLSNAKIKYAWIYTSSLTFAFTAYIRTPWPKQKAIILHTLYTHVNQVYS